MNGYIDLAIRVAGLAGGLTSAVLALLWKQQKTIWKLEHQLLERSIAGLEEKTAQLAQRHSKQQDLVNRFLERLVEAETLSRTMSRTVEQLGRTVQGLSEVLARLDGRIGRGGE